jgi:hypothetical protein
MPETNPATIPVKPICTALGISWAVQHRKLTSPATDISTRYMVIPRTRCHQSMLCIPVLDVPDWLNSINLAKLRGPPYLKVRVIQWQMDNIRRSFFNDEGAAQAILNVLQDLLQP